MTRSRFLIDQLTAAAVNQPDAEFTTLNRDNAHWIDYAACAHSVHPEAWWPPPQIWRAPPEASRVCLACPARWQCLQHALDHGEPGVWGGLTEPERRHLSTQTRTLVAKLAHQPIGSAAAAV